MVWPNSRARPDRPLATLARCAGTLNMMKRWLGDRNSPNPVPHSAMGSITAHIGAPAGSPLTVSRPAASSARPTAPSRLADMRSDHLPENGARQAPITGQGAISIPTSAMPRPSVWFSRNGSATMAAPCAAKASTHTSTAIEKGARRSRSSGTIACALRRSRRSSSAQLSAQHAQIRAVPQSGCAARSRPRTASPNASAHSTAAPASSALPSPGKRGRCRRASINATRQKGTFT